MEDQDILTQLLQNPNQKVDPQWVRRMTDSNPAFIIPAVLLLKRNPESVTDKMREHLQRQVALNCADRTALADFIDLTDAGWASFYPQAETVQQTTEQTIDDFIDTYGKPSTPEEDSILERLIFNPVPLDYFSGTDTPFDPNDPLALPPELLPKEENSHTADTKEPSVEAQADAELNEGADDTQSAPQAQDESLLMESLAKIFIKQHRYERAYEIISKLSLKNPEKSVYFADQLRFLQKLMINQKYLTEK